MIEVVERAKTPDGIEILLEDWRAKNTVEYPNLYGLVIAAYPKAKTSGRYGLIQFGKQFRLCVGMNAYRGYTNEMVLEDFEALKSGEKTLEDLSNRYNNGDKDKYYMGLVDIEPM